MRRSRILATGLAAAALAGCVHIRRPPPPVPTPLPGTEAPGVTNNYGQAELPEGALIAVQGDDLVYGADPRRGRRPGAAGSPVARSHATVGRELEKLLAASTGRVRVEERGYPGDTLEAGTKRWADRDPPDMLVLSYAYGDAIAGTAASTFQAQLSAAVAGAQAQHAYVVLIVYPSVKDPKLNAKLEPYRAADRAVAAAQRAMLIEAEAARGPTGVKPAGLDQPPEMNRQIAALVAQRVQVVQARPDA